MSKSRKDAISAIGFMDYPLFLHLAHLIIFGLKQRNSKPWLGEVSSIVAVMAVDSDIKGGKRLKEQDVYTAMVPDTLATTRGISGVYDDSTTHNSELKPLIMQDSIKAEDFHAIYKQLATLAISEDVTKKGIEDVVETAIKSRFYPH